MRLESNRVHVIPSGPISPSKPGSWRSCRGDERVTAPTDRLLLSCARGGRRGASHRSGLVGLRRRRQRGPQGDQVRRGIAIVQEPSSAQFRSMPENALAAGVVDFQSNPEGIARELGRLSRHRHARERSTEEQGDADSGRETALRDDLLSTAPACRSGLRRLQADDDAAAHREAHGAARGDCSP